MNYKKLFLTICFLLGVVVLINAQDIKSRNVPSAVKAAFNKQYASASDIDWKKSGSNYKVSFDMGSVDHKATYTPSGKVISFEKDIPNSSLPQAITANINAKYPKATIDDVTWINTSGVITYKIGLDGAPDATLWYTSAGKFIKQVAD
nr:PepSY-like domain-containing protein [Mucilaginibacter sp. L294]